MVVVGHLTKMVHFIPCNKLIIGKKTIKLAFDHVFSCHGLLKDIFFIVDLCLHPSFGSSSSSY
jgi:hypothetical protein